MLRQGDGAEHVDVLIVGAGLSGVGQAWHLQRRCPDRSFAILEARGAIGGTWDLFRYPGVRSDSDMHTLGYAFRPWAGERAIADGASIRDYIAETAREHGIDRHIRFGTRVTAARWSSAEARWTVEVCGPDGTATLTCDWLCMCSGYYDYARGHAPDFAGADSFTGQIVHPQFWPEGLDYTNKRVVVIGSGATAVTLVPAMVAGGAAQVTMLQRSPGYVVSRPGRDGIGDWLRRWLPARWAYRLTRWKNVGVGIVFFRLARTRPDTVKRRMIDGVRGELGPDYDVATHFTPAYKPWDQRVCLVPDADLFGAIRSGRAEVVTDTIDTFTPAGIRLASGRELAADVVVTATGLEIALMGDVAFTVDGDAVDLAKRVQYKGMMLADVPNLSFTFGYTNASWTLKADLVSGYVCRVLNTMTRRGMRQAMPHGDDPAMALEPALSFTSGYVQRAAHRLPPQGARRPWRLNQNYVLDLVALRWGSVTDGMIFSHPITRDSRRTSTDVVRAGA